MYLCRSNFIRCNFSYPDIMRCTCWNFFFLTTVKAVFPSRICQMVFVSGLWSLSPFCKITCKNFDSWESNFLEMLLAAGWAEFITQAIRAPLRYLKNFRGKKIHWFSSNDPPGNLFVTSMYVCHDPPFQKQYFKGTEGLYPFISGHSILLMKIVKLWDTP